MVLRSGSTIISGINMCTRNSTAAVKKKGHKLFVFEDTTVAAAFIFLVTQGATHRQHRPDVYGRETPTWATL